jgi:two-component system cell cycle response regulator
MTTDGSTPEVTLPNQGLEERKPLPQKPRSRRAIMRRNRQLAQERDEAKENVGIDALTHLPNRQRFNEDLEKRVAQAKRSKKNFYLLAIDFDHFKDVNDVYGHSVGDALLKGMGHLKSRLGEPIYRLGGDEFAQIIEDTAEDELYIIAERYQELIRKISSEILSSSAVLETADSNRPVRKMIDLSIGFAPYVQGDSAEDIVTQADAAMYDSKKHEGVASLAVTDTLNRRHYRQVRRS